MVGRLAAIFVLGAGLGYGCDCYTQNVRITRKSADIIFQGKIVAFRTADDGQRKAVFSVERVWKGDVPATFEMFAWEGGMGCVSFPRGLLEVGNELLVYARRIESDYMTDECSRTALVSKTSDRVELGCGHAPKAKSAQIR